MPASYKQPAPEPRCRSCYHFYSKQFDQMREIKTGQCKRYPPQITRYHHKGDTIEEYARPHVTASDWCGEYEQAEGQNEH